MFVYVIVILFHNHFLSFFRSECAKVIRQASNPDDELLCKLSVIAALFYGWQMHDICNETVYFPVEEELYNFMQLFPNRSCLFQYSSISERDIMFREVKNWRTEWGGSVVLMNRVKDVFGSKSR